MQESYATRVNIMRPDALSVKGYAFRRRCTITVGPAWAYHHTPLPHPHFLPILPYSRFYSNAWYQLTFEHGVSDPSPTVRLTPTLTDNPRRVSRIRWRRKPDHCAITGDLPAASYKLRASRSLPQTQIRPAPPHTYPLLSESYTTPVPFPTIQAAENYLQVSSPIRKPLKVDYRCLSYTKCRLPSAAANTNSALTASLSTWTSEHDIRNGQHS